MNSVCDKKLYLNKIKDNNKDEEDIKNFGTHKKNASIDFFKNMKYVQLKQSIMKVLNSSPEIAKKATHKNSSQSKLVTIDIQKK